MTSFARLKPFYVSMSCRNNALTNYDVATSPDSTIDAVCKTVFNSAIVEKASDFVIAIERMELSCNAIPFYDSTDTSVSHTIYIRSLTNNMLAPQGTALVWNAYSITHLLSLLNSLTFTDPNNLADPKFSIIWTLSSDGFIWMTMPPGAKYTFDVLQVEIPQSLNNILGISTTLQLPGTRECRSVYPRLDLGDDLDHIVLRTDLPTYSDSLGNVKLPVLTDFSPPSAFSSTLTVGPNGIFEDNAFSTNMRQKLIYTPSERRYLELVGDFPINNITVDAFYQSNNSKLKKVVLPLGGCFEIKIGFYLRQ